MAQFTVPLQFKFINVSGVLRNGQLDMINSKLRVRGASRAYTFSSQNSHKSTHYLNNNNNTDGDYDDDVVDHGDYVDFVEFDDDDLSCFRGLVLDVAYRPINVVCWKRAICLEFMEKADVLEYYDQTVNSPSGSFNIPAVLRVPHLLQFVQRRKIKNTISRKNILSRDNYTCQYCCSRENLTIDHVMPIARGGEWKWENLVVACSRCNTRKGPKTLEEANMKLIKVPKALKEYDIVAIPLTSSAVSMLYMKNGTPEEWHQYLSKPPSSQP